MKVQGCSQRRVPGILEPPFLVMKMDIISREKKYWNPPFEIPRDNIIIFQYSPKHNMFLLATIEEETPEGSKTTFLRLCRTRWVERHEAHEVFFAVLPSILTALEAMSNERLFANQFGETVWNWDTDSKSKAKSLLHPVSNFEFIITQIMTTKCLSIMKLLSIKLQKRDIDDYEAYSHIKDLLVGQQHQSNVETGTPRDYYKRALTIPVLDHLISEIDTYFDPNNDAVMSSILCLLPALLVSRQGDPVQATLQYYTDILYRFLMWNFSVGGANG